ncbi:MAG: hypothetical protein QME71_01110 [Dehalococcoidia bacterium]|nr:hypothetical protein [Dehalococcoidia bacterium]
MTAVVSAEGTRGLPAGSGGGVVRGMQASCVVAPRAPKALKAVALGDSLPASRARRHRAPRLLCASRLTLRPDPALDSI